MKLMKKIFAVLAVVELSAVFIWAADRDTVVHVVGVGETLASIAEKYGTAESVIKESNPDVTDIVYVGMKLAIPLSGGKEDSAGTETPGDGGLTMTEGAFSAMGSSAGSGNTDTESTEGKEDDRKFSFFEVGYTAGSFESVRYSGMYGLSMTFLTWDLAPDLYAGVHFSPLNFNFGLAPEGFESDVVMLGPVIGYCLTPYLLLAAPLDVLCNIYGIGSDKWQASWGMALSPTLYVGKEAGIYIGTVFSVSFSGNSAVSCGFRTGIYF